MNFKTFIILLLILCSFSCKKRVEKTSAEFIGEWMCWAGSDWYYYLDIDEDSKATYTEDSPYGGGASFSGVARANEDKLTIGGIHTFRIIQYPTKIDTADHEGAVGFPPNMKIANWKMVLEGPKLYLGSGTYYMADY